MDEWGWLIPVTILVAGMMAALIIFTVSETNRNKIFDQQKNERCLELIKVGQYAGCGKLK